MDIFLSRDQVFEAYTIEHYLPLILIALFGTSIIIIARSRFNEIQQSRCLFYISLIPFIGAFMLYPLATYEGDINIKEDLPLHMCRAIALASPFIVLKSSRYWIGVFYFWIMAGTLNANITPDVEYGFPHWSYFSYWMMHSFLVIIPLYYVIVLKVKINTRDLWNAFIMMNAFVIVTLVVNFILDSNYMYTRAKPPVDSLLDVLGPWPLYLITGQLLAAGLFYLAYLPFQINRILRPSDLNPQARQNKAG